MDEFYSKARNHYQQQLPFVLYCKPGSSVINGFLQQDDQLFQTVDFHEVGFVFVSFDRSRNILIPENKSEIITVNKATIYYEDTLLSKYYDNDSKVQFEKLVSKGINAVNQKILSKVVLSRMEVIEINAFDFILTFEKLASAYPTAFCYCFFHPKVGMWFGATPEQLLKIEDRKFSTTALAGTQQFNDVENVIWESKEKVEQQIVTDFIMENLENIASDVAMSNPYTYRAGNLLHIKTDIEGSFDSSSSLKQVIDILHPTPAVCGLPKETATAFILENEGYDRSFYTGFLGELNLQHQTNLFVNLRCMEIKQKNAHLYMGCGVTKDSDPEREFEETVSKSMTMKKILF